MKPYLKYITLFIILTLIGVLEINLYSKETLDTNIQTKKEQKTEFKDNSQKEQQEEKSNEETVSAPEEKTTKGEETTSEKENNTSNSPVTNSNQMVTPIESKGETPSKIASENEIGTVSSSTNPKDLTTNSNIPSEFTENDNVVEVISDYNTSEDLTSNKNTTTNNSIQIFKNIQEENVTIEVDPSIYKEASNPKTETTPSVTNNSSITPSPKNTTSEEFSTSNQQANSKNKFSQSDVNKLKTKTNLKVVKKFTYKETNLVNKIYTSGNYTAAQTLVVFGNYYLVTQSSSASRTDTTIYTHIYNKESHHQLKTFKAELGHSAGGTYNPNNQKIYFSWGHGTNYYATISKNNIISQKDVNVQKKSLNKRGNGWTFDTNTNKFYIKNGKVVYVYDEDFNYQKKYSILRSSGQDICNINGMLVNLVSEGGLDFYRISDGKYLGTYEFPSKAGKIKLEMESCDYYGTDNKLLVLVNYGGASENGKRYDGVHLINVTLDDFK